MIKLPPVATILTFGAVFVAMALVAYRLLWAAAQISGFGVLLPTRLQKLRRWLQGEPAHKKPN